MLSKIHVTNDYVADLLTVLKVEGFSEPVYYDRAPKNTAGEYQNVTIGDGINIDWSNTTSLKLVLSEIGLVAAYDAAEAARRASAAPQEPPETAVQRKARIESMVVAFKQLMAIYRPAEGANLESTESRSAELGLKMNELATQFAGMPFEFLITPTSSASVVHKIVAGGAIPDFGGTFKGKQESLDTRLGQTQLNQSVLLHNSREYAAIMSVFYNSPNTVPPGSKLATALLSDNRAEAWYEIRYNTNKGALSSNPSDIARGIAKRRYLEATVFGLYGSDTNGVTAEEALSIFRMVSAHRKTIVAYEKRYGKPVDGSNNIRNMISEGNDEPTYQDALSTLSLSSIPELPNALDMAKLALLQDLRENKHSEIAAYLQDSAFAAQNIYTTNYAISEVDNIGVADSRPYQTENYAQGANDLLLGTDGGNDILYSGAQDDVLIGEAGDDWLIGGAGNDVLVGGSGFDTYVFHAGDGHDIILDDDARGAIVRGTNTLEFSKLSIGLTSGTNTWSEAGVDYSFNPVTSDFLIAFTDGSGDTITIKNFDPLLATGDFLGIRLVDAPSSPTGEVRTFFGDKQDWDSDPNQSGIQTETDAYGNTVRADGQGSPDPRPDIDEPDREDFFYGSDANEVERFITAGGNDTVYADGAASTTSAVGGEDIVEAGAGSDIVAGGAGDDWLEGGTEDDILGGNEGNDSLFAESSNAGALTIDLAIVQGESGMQRAGQGDLLSGDAGDDVLFSDAGADYLAGGLGEDIIIGGAGDDTIYGDGSVTSAQRGWSVLRTRTDVGSTSTFTVNPTGIVLVSDDALGGLDVIYGGAGADWIFAGAGDDYVEGGIGDDVLFGDAGHDVLIGGDGNDVLVGDSVSADAAGLSGDDYLVGGAGDDELIGGKGNDYLDGGDGFDRLSGGDGDDTLAGGPGIDVLIGGAGKDTYVFNLGDGQEIIDDAPSGPDDPEASVLVLGPGISPGDVKFRPGSLIVDLGNGDSIQFLGFDLEDPLSTPVLDAIEFQSGGFMTLEDVLEQGFDIDGTSADDEIYGTAVTDRILAGDGNDYVEAKAGDDTIDGGTGNDEIYAGEGNDIVTAGDGDDFVDGAGGDDTIDGGLGDDTLKGSDGADTISGGDGQDLLLGGTGDDVLNGDAGDDTLDGGTGSDTLAGGSGSDAYVIYGGMGSDTVSDGQASETNILQLGAGLSLANLKTTQVGDSLVVSLRGLKDSITITDYYTRPQDWLVRDFAGAETTLQTVIDLPDPYGADFVARLWADTKLGATAAALGQAYAIGWSPLDGNTFEGFQESAYLDYLRQTTVETFTRFDPPNDVLAQNTFEDLSHTVEGFDGRSSSTFFWIQHSFESAYLESDDAFIQGDYGSLPQQQSQGQALLTLKPDRLLLGYQLTQSSVPTTVVSYDTGTETILAYVAYENEVESYNRFADVTSVDLNTSDWFHSVDQIFGNKVLVDMTQIESRYLVVNEIIGGSSDNFINAGFSSTSFPLTTLVDGGAGNDTLLGDGGLLYGNSGDDQITGTDAIMIGGDGDDTITGQGGSTFVYTATETGIDAISDSTIAAESYLDWYYAGLGLADWRESVEHGGEYRVSVDDGESNSYDYYETLEEAEQSGGDDVTFVEPLPVSAPLVRRSDGAMLEVLENAGVLKRDVVKFGPGLALTDLDLTVRVSGAVADAHPEEPWFGGGKLFVRWGSGAGFDVDVADSGYGVIGDDLFADPTTFESYELGAGVELFEFFDGSRYTLDEVLQQATLQPLYGYQFERGSGSQVIEALWSSVDFAPDIAPSDLYVYYDGSDDLIFGVIADSALGRIQHWYANPANIPQIEFHFANGTVFDTDTVTRFGRTQKGSPFADYLVADPYFASALFGLEGSDVLVGGNGNDLLNGGPGYDFLSGESGNDIYEFGFDSDVDVVDEQVQGGGSKGTDTVRFAADVATGDLAATRSYNALTLFVGGGGAELQLSAWFTEPGGIVETFEFADGTIWHAAEVEALLPPQFATSGDDFLLGLTGDDVIDGLEGDDAIYGFAGDDILRGGPGYDFLGGAAGNDTYLFGPGDGVDEIWDLSGTNVLEFDVGIDPESVLVTRDDSYLYLVVGQGGDRVVIQDWFELEASRLAQVAFADGTIWGTAELESRVTLVPATEFDDILWGTDGADVIHGLAGEDQIYGNGGDDVLEGGDDADYIVGGPGYDVLRGGAGDDDLEAWDVGNNFLDAGAGDDYLYYESSSIVIGGPGDDWIDVYGPNGMVAFNPGDGADTIYVADAFTLSIGGGIGAADLSLSPDGDDIVVNIAGADSVRLSRQWENDPRAWPTINLQLFGSVDIFDFNGVIDEFYAALAADPTLTDFALADVLPGYETASSETDAYGGAIAYRYGTTGTTAGLSNTQILSVLQNAQFGAAPQTITVSAGNSAPILENLIADQSTNEDAAFAFAVPATTFSDPDADALAYAATLGDGSALPSWLSFDTQTQTFSGMPLQADVGAIDVKLTATDGGGLSAEDTFTLTVANVNDIPVVSAADSELLLNDSVPASALFSVFDEDGQSPTQYEFFDDVAGGGHFTVNGVEQGAAAAIAVAAADLANTEYVAGANPGTERVWVRATDGEAWSAWKSWTMTSALHIPNAAPEVTPSAATQTVLLDQAVAASSLFSVLDADGDPAARYEFWDSTAGNGYFSVNGIGQGINTAIVVSAQDLANTAFVGASGAGSDQVWVRATDGQTFGAWKSWTMNSWPHATNAAPISDAPDGAVLRDQAVLAQSLFSVTDADADAIAQVEFWDDTPGGGYFAVGSVEQANNPIPVTAAQLADVEYVGGADPGTEQVWVRANDGLEWGAWEPWNMTTALHIPNAAPEAAPTAAAQVVLLGQAIDAASLFGASDADGDSIVEYQFFDSTAGNGHFAVNGVEQGINVNIVVAAAELADTQFVGSGMAGSDTVWVRASDGQSYGAWTSWTMNSWPHAANSAPVADAANAAVLTDETVAAASLFSVSDADGDAAARYEFWDAVAGGGYWRVNGVQQTAAAAIAVDAADLASTEYVGGANPGAEQVSVRVNDGLEWGAWQNWTLSTALHEPNAAPEVTVASSTLLFDQSVAASSLFSVTDADGDTITQYEFWDSTAGNGHFTVDGVEQGVNVAIGVTAAQLADTVFTGSATTGSDTVWVRANDGMAWSDWKSWTMNSWPHLTNASPVVTASSAGILRNEALSASMFFGVADADGDAVSAYEFWDDVNGGGYWVLDGIQQVSGGAIAVAAADLADLAYVGGANAGSEQVWARATDGMGWSAWKNWLMSTEGGMLRGGEGPDTLNGEAGPTVLQGGGGNDTLTDTDGNNLFSGGAGDDAMTGGDGDDLFAGGSGDDTISTGAGNNIIAYNAGGGIDTVYAAAGAANTLSFGGGIGYDDLILSKNGNDLIVSAGANDQVVLKDWYAGGASVLNLQIILDATEAFDANSSDSLYNKKVQTFDFAGMVAEFDDALAQSPGLTSWAVTNALLQFHLSGADDAAIGGDLAYWYGKNAGFTGISLAAAQQVIGAAGFGSDAQALRPFDGLQEGYVKLA